MELPRILTSSKFQSAIVVTVLGAIPVFYQLGDPDIPRAAKTDLLKTFIGAATATWVAAVVGTSAEDYAKKRDTPGANQQPAQPPVNIQNIGSADSVTSSAAPQPVRPPSPIDQALGRTPRT